MNYEEYKRKILEDDERNRLSELRTKYNGMSTPNYSNMSLRDELQTRFDLNELNELHNKYSGQQQTFTSWGDMQAPASQSAYTPPTQPIIKQPQSYGLYDILQVLNPISTANAQEYIGNSSAVDYSKYGEGFSKEYIDEMLADKRFQRALQKYANKESSTKGI